MFFCILGTKITDVSRKDTKKRVCVQMFKCQKIDFFISNYREIILYRSRKEPFEWFLFLFKLDKFVLF